MPATASLTGCGCSSPRGLAAAVRIIGDLMRLLADFESVREPASDSMLVAALQNAVDVRPDLAKQAERIKEIYYRKLTRPAYTATDLAERQLLGEILVFGTIPQEARSLRPEDFANEGRGRVFGAMLKAEPASMNEVLLAEALERDFPGAGWTASLDSLRAGCYLESHAVPDYCRIILASATRRRAEAWGKG